MTDYINIKLSNNFGELFLLIYWDLILKLVRLYKKIF